VTHAETGALLLSLRVAVVATAVAVPPGVALAWLLARRRFFGRALLDAVVHAPLVVPPVVVGYLLLVLLGPAAPLGGWLREALGIELAFTWRAAALASAVMGFPLLVRAVRLTMELADPRVEEAARTLGAGPARVFLTVTLPLALPGVLGGAVLCFARSLGEFGATIAFAGNIAGETRTLPLAVYSEMQLPGGDAAALRLALIAVALSLLALLGSEWMARRVRRLTEERT